MTVEQLLVIVVLVWTLYLVWPRPKRDAERRARIDALIGEYKKESGGGHVRAKLARVEALANQYEADYLAAPVEFFKDATQDIRAALADDTATGGRRPTDDS